MKRKPGETIGPRQRDFLTYLARLSCMAFPRPTFVNIGVQLGCSMHCLHDGCPQSDLIGVDIDDKWFTPTMKRISRRLIHGNSNAVHTRVDAPVHLLFIDGGHSASVVRGDIAGWVPKLPLGGIVAFHDLHMGPVHRAFSEWWRDAEKDWWEVPNSPLPGLRAFWRVR
jgi:hypothetical protein